MNENKFNGMGKIYSKYRPSYPINFIDYLFTGACHAPVRSKQGESW